MKNFVRNTLLLLVFLMQGVVRAQIYPVQTFVQVSPPYNSYLPDYADPFTNQLRVLLTLTDFSVPSTQVKLRFSIEGSGYSLQSVNLIAFPIITLTPGVPVEISGSDLAPYLSTANLVFSGLNPATYELSKILPEGPASICVEVVDVTSANQPTVGNPACAQTWFSLYDPPLLNTPFCGSEITPTDPKGILFSWTPLHMASPLSGSTEYEFELFEIRPNEGDPNVVVNSTLPIYTHTTTSTFLNYGIIEPPLQVGMSYVWRVKAKDPSLRNLYRNNGYSAVCTFTYGSIAGSLIAGIVLELNSNGTGVRQGLTWWNASDLFDSYTLELRKTGNPDYEWFPYTATEGNLKVNSLEPLTQYECRVKGIAGGAETEWSNTSTFTTQAQPNYACGSTVLPASSPIIKPLAYLLVSNIVSVGQFEMVVTASEPLALEGHFAGTGKIKVPFIGLNLHVIYDDIFIDEDMIMRSGRVDVITDGLDAWLDDQAVIFIDGIIDQPGGFEFNDDSTVTVFFGDQSLTFEFIEGQPLVFEDESGLIYTVYSDGRIEISGEITWDDDVLAGTANHQIRFEALADQTFGFDKKTYLQWTRLYPCIRLSDNSLYFVSYKSVGASETDQLVAYITSEETINTPTFKYADGTVLSSEKINDTTYHVTVGNTIDSKFIYGYDDQGAKIGKSILSVYEPITRDIVLVPVNGSDVPADVETYLNATFHQANVQFNITQAPNYENELYDLTADGLDAPDATLMQKYSTEMRTLRDDYFTTNPANSDTYYLFIVPEMANDYKGYMVRGKAVGFIENNQPAHTYAHEIAHGAFGLEHTFPAIPTGTTTNLLDYTNNSNHLAHHQWLEIHNFNPVFSILDDEEDGGVKLAGLRIGTLIDSIDFYFKGQICWENVRCEFEERYYQRIMESDSSNLDIIHSDSVKVRYYIDSVLTEQCIFQLHERNTHGKYWKRWNINDPLDKNDFTIKAFHDCDGRGKDSSYCDPEPITEPNLMVFDFAIYVAYPKATAGPGSGDNSVSALAYRLFMGKDENGEYKKIQVGHTGICLVKIDTSNMKAKLDYWDFGRFSCPGRSTQEGCKRYFDLDSINIILDKSDNTYKIDRMSEVDSLINTISYFHNDQSTYGYKEMAVLPINYNGAINVANNTFYDILKFGFENNSSYCTDFVHDVLLGGGITEIIMNDENKTNVIDISYVVSDNEYRELIKSILIKHNKDPLILKYIALDPELQNMPLPVNIARELRILYLQYYRP